MNVGGRGSNHICMVELCVGHFWVSQPFYKVWARHEFGIAWASSNVYNNLKTYLKGVSILSEILNCSYVFLHQNRKHLPAGQDWTDQKNLFTSHISQVYWDHVFAHRMVVHVCPCPIHSGHKSVQFPFLTWQTNR